MSMHTEIVYGYGFPITHITTKHFVDFIKNHEQTIEIITTPKIPNELTKSQKEIKRLLDFCKNMNENTKETSNPDDFEDDFYEIEDVYGIQGMFSILSQILYQETDIHFEYQQGDCDCDSDASIIFVTGMPWQFNETESNLTFECLNNIITNYATELGIPTTKDWSLSIEYYC